MAGEKTEEQKRKELEAQVLPNPFPTGVNQIVVPLYNGVFAEEGARVVNLSPRDPADKVELDHLGGSGSSEKPAPKTPAEVSDGFPRLQTSSWGTSSTSTSSSSSPGKQNNLEEEQCPSVRASGFGLGMFRPHTACAAAFKSGKLNEVNPVRDYAWAAIFAIAGLSCIIAGASHGNVPLIVGGVLLIALSSALAIRADRSNSDEKQSSNSAISYFPQTPIMF